MIELKDIVAGMPNEDYKKRFKAEFQQMFTRCVKLEDFVDKYENDLLEFVPDCSLDLLKKQMQCLREYIGILLQRALVEKINVMEDLF